MFKDCLPRMLAENQHCHFFIEVFLRYPVTFSPAVCESAVPREPKHEPAMHAYTVHTHTHRMSEWPYLKNPMDYK